MSRSGLVNEEACLFTAAVSIPVLVNEPFRVASLIARITDIRTVSIPVLVNEPFRV